MKKKEDYEITVLKGLEGIRKTAPMYIGDIETDAGLHHLLREIIDNSVDEYLEGHCNEIVITLHKDGSASVKDNGRGIPTYYMKEEKMSALESVFLTLHCGGKFNKSNYKYSGGLHGVGSSVTNALSDKLKVVVHRDGEECSISFSKGKKVEDLSRKPYKGKSGTFVRFSPDPLIFKNNVKFNPEEVKSKLRELAFLCEGLSIIFIDEIRKTEEEFSRTNGLSDFINFMANDKRLIDDPVVISSNKDSIIINMALQWTNEELDKDLCKYYTNNIPNPDGGTHAAGFKSGLTRAINSYVASSDMPKTLKFSLSGDDVREGLISVVSIRHQDPKFNSQDKVKLVSDDVRSAVESVVIDKFTAYLEQNPASTKKIISHCINVFKAREAAKKAREAVRKTSLGDSCGTLPGKLADCQEKDPDKCELFIVEGQSAGGCWISSTKLRCYDDRMVSIGQLLFEQEELGIQNSCYTIDETNNICEAPIVNIRKTKSNARVIKIVLDNGCEEICTPDHPLMLKNGDYIRADKSLNKDLRSFDFQIKVVEIIPLGEPMDVYDLEVPGTHNFALASGIFVHNSAKQGRDRRFQAILPLRGKVLNVERCEYQKLLKNEEIMNLITVIGAGIGKSFDPNNIRYGKVIVCTDADVDGAHIRSLLLTFFFRQMPQLIMNGNIYIAQPPLYRIDWHGVTYYLKDDAAKKAFMIERKMGKNAEFAKKFQRFKGLGEMASEQLWETTINPESRTLLQVKISNILEADRIFNILMGDLVDPRRDFIVNSAQYAKIDI